MFSTSVSLIDVNFTLEQRKDLGVATSIGSRNFEEKRLTKKA